MAIGMPRGESSVDDTCNGRKFLLKVRRGERQVGLGNEERFIKNGPFQRAKIFSYHEIPGTRAENKFNGLSPLTISVDFQVPFTFM